MVAPSELSSEQRRKLLRQHRDLRRVLEVTLSATEEAADSDSPGDRRLPLLVALALRLQNMLDRHFAFEESVLIPHFMVADPSRVDHLVDDHRKQRAELSVLAKLAFQNADLPRMGQAFRCLIQKILAEMDEEERDLLRGVRRRAGARTRARAVTGEFSTDPLADCDEAPALALADPAARRGPA
jgi:Hemerythrin HHE cation binding domain